MKINIDIEAFKYDYEVNLLSLQKLCNKYSICSSSASKLVKELGLHRDKNVLIAKSNKQTKGKIFENILNNISKDDLYNYYIKENHGYYETIEYFKITDYTFNKLLDKYDIKKDRSLTCKQSAKTREEKAGGKDLYNQNLDKKRKETIVNKYGSLDDYYEKVKITAENNNIAKYGFKYKATADLITKHSQNYLDVWSSRDKSLEYLNSFNEKKTVSELALDLNCTLYNVYLWIEKYKLSAFIKIEKSKYEEELLDFINSFGFKVIRNDRKTLNGSELDVFIPEKNLAIEFNGNFWHSDQKVSKNYHFNKSKMCEDKNIRLIHIYQYQWVNDVKREILKSIIKNALGVNDNIIYARKCEIRELRKNDVEDFSNKNSLHGHRNASIYLGLFYNDELVELMSFGKAFFSRDDSIDYECIRSITKLNTTVIGGMNKLFKYFIDKYNPNKILYYVDYNTHVGNSMSKLSFKFISYSKYGTINVANSKDVLEKYGYVFNRKPSKNKEIQEYCKKGKILTIYDAGVKKYIWERSN